MSELKPCPFCGDPAVIPGEVCELEGTGELGPLPVIEERTCKQKRLFNLMSRECDGEYYQWRDEEMPNFCPNCGAKVVGE